MMSFSLPSRVSLKYAQRYFSLSARSFGVWGDFSHRPQSLKVNDLIHHDLFEGIDEHKGPASSRRKLREKVYHSPELIDQTFAAAYKALESESGKNYEDIRILKEKLHKVNNDDEKKEIRDEIDRLLVIAESSNPAVVYNGYFDSTNVDRSHPVYREFLKERWQSHDLMVTMQRLEQLHVLPDTLPTFDPVVDVKVRFPHVTEKSLAGWISPGTVLPSFVVSQPPEIQIQEFERVEGKNLYTVVLVNPDTPELETNSFSTMLQYGLANVPLDNVDNTISMKKILEQGEEFTFKEYLPVLPEKNSPTQRACLWVFRQSGKLEISGDIMRQHFDIRFFAKQNDLLPIGAHVWRQEFDRSINKVRDAYGLGRGRVFHKIRNDRPLIL